MIHYAPYGPNAIGGFDCGVKASTPGEGFTSNPANVTCLRCKALSPGLWPEHDPQAQPTLSVDAAEMRKAFTLVEMLVVLTLIAILAALLVFTLPGFIDRSRAANGASAVQGWLNYARQRAQYEQEPRGVRFYVEQDDPNDPLSPWWSRKAQAIEQPDDWQGGPLVADPLNATDAHYIKVTGADFSSGAVQEGDYLEVNNTGQVHWIQVKTADPNSEAGIQPSNPAQPNVLDKLAIGLPGLPNPITEPIKDYRIMRAPRVAGDEPMLLPEHVAIDMMVYANPAYGTSYQSKNSFAPRLINNSADGKYKYFDVMFAPNGRFLDYPGAMLILWVRMDDAKTDFEGSPTLLVVSTNSGAVSAYDPVPPSVGPNPFAKVK
jgi:prepilin-type N-terminal cleavage/methylation domain-containing protein